MAAETAQTSAEAKPISGVSGIRRKPQEELIDLGGAGATAPEQAVTADALPPTSSEAALPTVDAQAEASHQVIEAGSAAHGSSGLAVAGGLGILGLVAAAAGGGGGGHHSSATQVEMPRLEPVIPQPQMPQPGPADDPKAQIPKLDLSRADTRKPDVPATSPDATVPGHSSVQAPTTPSTDHAIADTTPEPVVIAPPADTTPPAAVQLSLKYDTGADNKDLVTSDSTVTVSGLEDGATWRYSLDSGKTWHQGGNAEITASMADGSHDVQVIQTDAAGNDSGVASLQFRLETGAPTLSLKNDTGRSATDGITNDGTLTVSGLDDGAPWKYSIDGGKHWVDGSGTEIAAKALGSDGTKTVQVMQLDANGQGGYSELSFILDTTVSALSVRLRHDDGFDTQDRVSSDPVWLLDNLEQGAEVSWYGNGANLHTRPGAREFDISASQGLIQLSGLTQTDVAGNRSSSTSFASVYATDSDAPRLNVGAVRFGTSAADVFKIDATLSTVSIFNYHQDQGDAIDLSAIAGTDANISRDSGNSFWVQPGAEAGVGRIHVFFQSDVIAKPITVVMADGKVIDM